MIVMLTWIWLSALALLIGAEIEAAIERGGARPRPAKPEPAVPDADDAPTIAQSNATSAA